MKKTNENTYELGVAGKFALYDIKTGTRLTDYEYNRIISNYGQKHILIKCDDFIDENEKHFASLGKITFSAIANHDGSIKEIAGYTLGMCGGFNNGVCISFENSTQKYRLMNDNGKILSEPYPNIEPANRDNVFGLYTNINYTNDGKLKDVIVLFEDGKKVDYIIKEINKPEDYHKFLKIFRFIELDTIKKATDAIKKYGANIIEFLPNSIFETRQNYLDILYAVNDYVVKKNRNLNELLYSIGLLTNILSDFNPEKSELQNFKLPTKIAGETENVQEQIKEYITKFYNVLS